MIGIVLKATDDNRVTGYIEKTQPERLDPDHALWATAKPRSFLLDSVNGPRTLYTFVKDAAGNVTRATVTIFLDQFKPRRISTGPRMASH